MSQIAQLRVHDVTAVMRGNDPERPVLAGNDGTRVVVLIDQAYAEDLAKIIGLGTAAADGDLATDPEVWNQVVTDVLVSAADIDSTTFASVIGIAR